MKTIKTRIMTGIIFISFFALVITGGISSWMNYNSTIDALEQSISETVLIASNQVTAELTANMNLVKEFAYNTTLWSNVSTAEKIEQIHSMQTNSGFDIIKMTDAAGNDLESGQNISEMEAFQKVKTDGAPYITDPIMNEELNDMIIFFAVPVTKNDQFSGMIMGGKKAGFLTDIVAGIQVGENGNAAILNNKGDTIGFKDYDLVLQQYNTQKEAESDSKLKRLAEIEHNMASGKTGFGKYYYDGKEKMMAYCPIEGTDGWSIDIAVTPKDFMGGTVNGLIVTIVIMIVSLIAAVILAIKLSESIARPIMTTAERLKQLAEGDLETPVVLAKRKDETGLLADSLKQTVEDMREIITDITYHLGKMADGDFSTISDKTYKGGFQPIQDAIHNIEYSLNETLNQVNIASNEVANGAEQVAGGAQALSQGATEQASAIEELAATIGEISTAVKETAKGANHVSDENGTVSNKLKQSNMEMQQMMEAMNKINASSGDIGKVIKTIEDIAFQTNILALNAAVEAARAGNAGKGFAVVADEVRNLASKSGDAAKNTTGMIEESIQAISGGAKIAQETARSLSSVVEGSRVITEAVEEIKRAVEQQSDSIEQIRIGMDQVAAVVQTNSATAEESAAASEELTSQAKVLEELVSKFKLNQDTFK